MIKPLSKLFFSSFLSSLHISISLEFMSLCNIFLKHSVQLYGKQAPTQKFVKFKKLMTFLSSSFVNELFFI